MTLKYHMTLNIIFSVVRHMLLGYIGYHLRVVQWDVQYYERMYPISTKNHKGIQRLLHKNSKLASVIRIFLKVHSILGPISYYFA